MRLKMMGGGDSVDYDALTAMAADVPEGLIFIGQGSDEEQTGSLPDRRNMHGAPGYSDADQDVPVHQAVMVSTTRNTYGETQVVLAPPRGKFPGDTSAFVGCSPSDIGVTAEKVANGQTAAGIKGTYGADGNLTSADLKEGKIGYGANGKVSGGAMDYGAVSKTLAAGESYTINKGFYGAGKVTAKDLASQTNGTATAAHILKGFTAWIKGKLVTGSMKNISEDATITHTTDNKTKVVLGDACYVSKNSDGTERLQIRYNGTAGYITANTLFAISYDKLRSALGITASKIIKGQSIAGVNGSAGRGVKTTWSTSISQNCTGYSGTAGNRAVSIGSPYSEWDTVVMRIWPATTYYGQVTVALSKGKNMRIPLTTTKYSDSQYQNAWTSISRSSSGEIKFSPFRGNVSGTYTVNIEIVAVFDGIVAADD